ncbi:hypothetical protein GCM10020000_39800 [Streptomyces olivoverticillatus]
MHGGAMVEGSMTQGAGQGPAARTTAAMPPFPGYAAPPPMPGYERSAPAVDPGREFPEYQKFPEGYTPHCPRPAGHHPQQRPGRPPASPRTCRRSS